MILQSWITISPVHLNNQLSNSELMPQIAKFRGPIAFTVHSIQLHRGNKELGRRALRLLNLHRRINQPGEHEACIESNCTRQGKECI